MVVRDRHARRRPTSARLDRYVIVTGADPAARDSDVRRPRRVDAVGVARAPAWRPYLHAPGREAVRLVDDHLEIRRVADGNTIQREIVRLVGDDYAEVVLTAVGGRTRLLGQVPPGYVLSQQLLAAAAVDYAIAHDRGVVRVDVDKRLATAPPGIDSSTTPRLSIIEFRISGRE